MPKVSIIIVTWNALPLLKRCLPSVVATDYPDFEIILADNASTDGSASWVHEQFPDIRIIRHPENWAFCKGNNEAIPHATGEYLVLLNNDVEVPAGWLRPLVAVLERDPEVAAVQPKLLQYADRSCFEYAGACGGFLDRYGYPFTRGRIFSTVERDEGQYDDARDIFWATGAALLLRRAVIDEVGLFDERFHLHMEEIDLCWRLMRREYRIRVEPASEVYHIGGGSLPQGNPRKTYYNFRNSLLVLFKNLPASEWRARLPGRICLDAAASVRALLSGKPRESLAILGAYRDALRMKKHYRSPGEEAPAALPFYRKSIAAAYYLKKRHTFSSLSPQDFSEYRPVSASYRAAAPSIRLPAP